MLMSKKNGFAIEKTTALTPLRGQGHNQPKKTSGRFADGQVNGLGGSYGFVHSPARQTRQKTGEICQGHFTTIVPGIPILVTTTFITIV